ncbi:Pyruvate%2C phosphate dikinase [Segatella copri]|nr:Pyruvate%2C phosphate dikinase [Segatella copri]
MNEKRVYTFGNGKAEGNAQMREVLGGKGANLAEMNLIGVPVPPGFTITTDTYEQQVRFCRESTPRISTLRCTRIYAWYDGYHPQPRFE